MKDKIVFITGGTSGYGKAMAKLFTDEGAKVIVAARKADELAQTAQELGCEFNQIDYMHLTCKGHETLASALARLVPTLI